MPALNARRGGAGKFTRDDGSDGFQDLWRLYLVIEFVSTRARRCKPAASRSISLLAAEDVSIVFFVDSLVSSERFVSSKRFSCMDSPFFSFFLLFVHVIFSDRVVKRIPFFPFIVYNYRVWKRSFVYRSSRVLQSFNRSNVSRMVNSSSAVRKTDFV